MTYKRRTIDDDFIANKDMEKEMKKREDKRIIQLLLIALLIFASFMAGRISQ